MTDIVVTSTQALIEYINPLHYVSAASYSRIWQHILATVLQGFWARFFASASLCMSFFVGVYRQQVIPGVFFFVLAVAIAYGGALVRLVFGW